MRDWKDCSCEEAAGHFLSHFARSAIGEEAEPVFCSLAAMFEALSAGEVPLALRQYHIATRRMLDCPARRVSGNLWRDYLLYLLLQRSNRFSAAAAARNMGEALSLNLKEELSILGGLSELDSAPIARFFGEKQRETRQRLPAKDNISIMSTAVWAGYNNRPLPRGGSEGQTSERQPQIPLCFTPWDYGKAGLLDSYVADEALEEIYYRLLSAADWATVADDIISFFASYGSGDFLRYRAFRLDRGELLPLGEEAMTPIVPISLYESQRMRLMENTIHFMQGEKAAGMLLYGGSGVGKTAQVLSLLHELPEVRLIVVSEATLRDAAGILPLLKSQPLRFVLLLDDINPDGKELRAFSSALCAQRELPENVLLCATARGSVQSGLFSLALNFPYPSLQEFTGLVVELLEADGVYADRTVLHNAGIDHQVDVQNKLTFSGARFIAENYKRLKN